VRRAIYLDSNLPGGRLRVSIPDDNVDVWMMARNLSKVKSWALGQQDAIGHMCGLQRRMLVQLVSNPLLACRKAIARRDGKCESLTAMQCTKKTVNEGDGH